MAGYTGHERQYADGKASRCLLACTQGNAFQCCNVLLRNRVQCHGLATHNPWGGCSHLHLTCSHLERFKFISPKMAHLPLHMKYSEMTGRTTAPHLSPWCQPSNLHRYRRICAADAVVLGLDVGGFFFNCLNGCSLGAVLASARGEPGLLSVGA